jgi:hypothetical protein
LIQKADQGGSLKNYVSIQKIKANDVTKNFWPKNFGLL